MLTRTSIYHDTDTRMALITVFQFLLVAN